MRDVVFVVLLLLLLSRPPCFWIDVCEVASYGVESVVESAPSAPPWLRRKIEAAV